MLVLTLVAAGTVLSDRLPWFITSIAIGYCAANDRSIEKNRFILFGKQQRSIYFFFAAHYRISLTHVRCGGVNDMCQFRISMLLLVYYTISTYSCWTRNRLIGLIYTYSDRSVLKLSFHVTDIIRILSSHGVHLPSHPSF